MTILSEPLMRPAYVKVLASGFGFETGIEIHSVRDTGRDGFFDIFRSEPAGQQPGAGSVQAAQPFGAVRFPLPPPDIPASSRNIPVDAACRFMVSSSAARSG